MRNDYLIRKKPMRALVLFSLPIIIGNLFQHTYTMADSAIVGRFVSERALAAVGASYSLTNIFISVAIGGGIGSSVLVSRYFGSKEYAKMKTALFTALCSFLALSLLLGGFGLIFSRRIMILLRTPSDVLGSACEYLNIYFLGLPFLFMYNVLSAMFNALGKSRIPLYFLIFSSLFNIALDYLLVTGFGLGVAGVAWATLIAQSISAVLSFLVLTIILKKIERGSTAVFSLKELALMIKIAFPSILQQSTVSIGLVLVQSVVNSFGYEILAGFSAASRVSSLCIVPMIGIGTAMSSYTAQNIGAKKNRRVILGYRATNKLVVLFSVIILVILEFFSRAIISLFLGSNGTDLAMATGRGYLTFIGFFYCLIGFKSSADGLLRGAGDMKMFTVANFVNLSIRVAVAIAFAPRFGISMVWIAIPIGWFFNWLISFTEYRTGKWEKIYV